MVEKSAPKPESVLNLEDLLQCPVCYEIPPGQIFQCNEGHHVCGGCKMRLDVCPVCRALFFGTRNYAMEELITNFRKMRSLKLSSKASGSGSSQSSSPALETTSVEHENNESENEDVEEESNTINVSEQPLRPPQPCSGLFRCLCCKTGSTARLPSARLLNHLRYFHAPDLLEGRSENGEYLQAWQFATVPGKLVTAVRISDMGIFFLTIDITPISVCAWLAMAAAPWVAHGFSYTITICGNDREAIFSDSVWSVRSCEGALKKRGHCLLVTNQDARALTAPAAISGKLSVRRTPTDLLSALTTPRAVLRIANRVNNQNSSSDLEPFLQELQNDVARLSQAFATLGRESNALVQSESQMRARIANIQQASESTSISDSDAEPPAEQSEPQPERQELTRNARKRLRQRLRAALDGTIPPEAPTATNRAQASSAASQPRQNGPVTQPRQNTSSQPRQNAPVTLPRQTTPTTQPRPNTIQLRENTPITEVRVNPPVTQPRQNAPVTQPRQSTPVTQPRQNTSGNQQRQNTSGNQQRQNTSGNQQRQNTSGNQQRQNTSGTQPRQNGLLSFSGFNIVTESTPPVAPPPAGPSSSTAQLEPQTGNNSSNKKKRRHRR